MLRKIVLQLWRFVAEEFASPDIIPGGEGALLRVRVPRTQLESARRIGEFKFEIQERVAPEFITVEDIFTFERPSRLAQELGARIPRAEPISTSHP